MRQVHEHVVLWDVVHLRPLAVHEVCLRAIHQRLPLAGGKDAAPSGSQVHEPLKGCAGLQQLAPKGHALGLGARAKDVQRPAHDQPGLGCLRLQERAGVRSAGVGEAAFIRPHHRKRPIVQTIARRHAGARAPILKVGPQTSAAQLQAGVLIANEPPRVAKQQPPQHGRRPPHHGPVIQGVETVNRQRAHGANPKEGREHRVAAHHGVQTSPARVASCPPEDSLKRHRRRVEQRDVWH